MKFPQVLTYLRESKGMSKTELANGIGLSITFIILAENPNNRKPPKIGRCHQIADVLGLNKEERDRLISAAISERLDQDEIAWIESQKKSLIPCDTSAACLENNLSKDIIDALGDPLAVKALLATHKNKKDIKESIQKLIEMFPSMEPEKRKAILALCT